MTSEATADISVIVLDSDDELSNHVPLVTDYFQKVKKSAKNLGFSGKKSDNSPVAFNSEDDVSEKTPKKSTDSVLQRISFMGSPADQDFFQEFDSSSESNKEIHNINDDFESDSDLDIPLSKRLAWKGNNETHEDSNDVKSDDVSVIALDDDSQSIKLSSDTVEEKSNDSFFIEEIQKYRFTSVSEKKEVEKHLVITEDKETVSEKGKKKKSSPKKKIRNEKNKASSATNNQESQKNETGICQKANKEVRKIRNIEEALKGCKAIIDSNLSNKYFKNGELGDVFQDICPYELSDTPLTSNCVVWKRKIDHASEDKTGENDLVTNGEKITDEFEDHMLLIFEVNTIRQLVNAYLDNTEMPTLKDLVMEVFDQFKKNLTLIFYGLESYYRRIANNQNKKFRNGVFADDKQKINRKKRESLPPLRREDVEEMIVDMQISLSQIKYRNLRVTVRNVETPSELAKMIFLYSKTIAGKPLKENRLEEHGYAWYVTGDVKGSVDIKCSEDITKLWTQQLMQFPKISNDIATSIALKYPSLFSLASKYRKMNDKAAAESLLSDIKIIRRGEVTNRRVGIEMSKRIYTYMTCSDPDVLLS